MESLGISLQIVDVKWTSTVVVESESHSRDLRINVWVYLTHWPARYPEELLKRESNLEAQQGGR